MYFCLNKELVCVQHNELKDGQVCYETEDECNAAVPERKQVYCLGEETLQFGAKRVHACQHGSLDLCKDGKDAQTFSSLQECFAQYPHGKVEAENRTSDSKEASSGSSGHYLGGLNFGKDAPSHIQKQRIAQRDRCFKGPPSPTV